MKLDLKPISNIHKLFPVDVMEFEGIEIDQCVIDALRHEELGMYNFPSTVYTSRGDLHKRPEFSNLLRQIQECLNSYMVHYYLDTEKLAVSLMWAVLSREKSGGCHPMHRHAMSVVSGILYLTDGVSTVFHDPVTARNYDTLEVMRRDGWEPYEYIPARKGTLILFPGWFMHSSQPNTEDKERWCISFNTMPEGDTNNTADDYPQVRLKVL